MYGAGHSAAMWRLGLKELAQALPAFPNNQHVIEEPGAAGNVVPQEVLFGKLQAQEKAQQQIQDKAQDLGMER